MLGTLTKCHKTNGLESYLTVGGWKWEVSILALYLLRARGQSCSFPSGLPLGSQMATFMFARRSPWARASVTKYPFYRTPVLLGWNLPS